MKVSLITSTTKSHKAFLAFLFISLLAIVIWQMPIGVVSKQLGNQTA